MLQRVAPTLMRQFFPRVVECAAVRGPRRDYRLYPMMMMMMTECRCAIVPVFSVSVRFPTTDFVFDSFPLHSLTLIFTLAYRSALLSLLSALDDHHPERPTLMREFLFYLSTGCAVCFRTSLPVCVCSTLRGNMSSVFYTRVFARALKLPLLLVSYVLHVVARMSVAWRFRYMTGKKEWCGQMTPERALFMFSCFVLFLFCLYLLF